MCELLTCTPAELGENRHNNPDGIRFLEESFIHQWKEEEKARKKAERNSRRKR